MNKTASQRGASNNIIDFSKLSYPDGSHNSSCLGLCDKNICPKSYELGICNLKLPVSM